MNTKRLLWTLPALLAVAGPLYGQEKGGGMKGAAMPKSEIRTDFLASPLAVGHVPPSWESRAGLALGEVEIGSVVGRDNAPRIAGRVRLPDTTLSGAEQAAVGKLRTTLRIGTASMSGRIVGRVRLLS